MRRTHLLLLALLMVAIVGVVIAKRVITRSPSATSTDSRVLSGDDLSEALKSGRPTMAEFGLGTCEVCKRMAPLLEQAADGYAGKANIVSVDLDDHPAVGRYYQIRAMPTQVFFDSEGEEVGRHVGFLPSEEIEAKLAELGVK